MKVPQASEESLRHQLRQTDSDRAIESTLNYWVGTAFRFVKQREPSASEVEDMRESPYDLAQEIQGEE